MSRTKDDKYYYNQDAFGVEKAMNSKDRRIAIQKGGEIMSEKLKTLTKD